MLKLKYSREEVVKFCDTDRYTFIRSQFVTSKIYTDENETLNYGVAVLESRRYRDGPHRLAILYY